MPPNVTPAVSSSPQVINGGDGVNIHVLGGTNTVNLLGSHGTITTDAGTNTLFTNGTGNAIMGGAGTDTIRAGVCRRKRVKGWLGHREYQFRRLEQYDLCWFRQRHDQR